MAHNAVDTCNACDALGVDSDSLAGYCTFCEAEAKKVPDLVTCGTCGRTWDDSIVTGMTPAPAARCPFEGFHDGETVPDDYPVAVFSEDPAIVAAAHLETERAELLGRISAANVETLRSLARFVEVMAEWRRL